VDMRAIIIKIDPPLTNIRLADLLDAIVKVADAPVKYSIEDYCIVFSLRGRETTPLYIRTFKVDPNALLESLHVAKGPVEALLEPDDSSHSGGLNFVRGPAGTIVRAPAGADWPAPVVTALREWLAKAGVDLEPARNPGKALFYNDRQGLIIVRATLQDLDTIEQVIAGVNTPPPQINIKAKFVEVSQDDAKALGLDWHLGIMLMTNSQTGGHVRTAPSANGAPSAANPVGILPGNLSSGTNRHPLNSSPHLAGNSPATLTGILTEPQYRMALKALQQRDGVEVIAQPEVTLSSGRQAQCKAVDVRSVVKGIDPRALTPPGVTSTNDAESSVYATESMECGPVLDVIPTVLPDGYTIHVPLIVSMVEFLGYEDNRTNRVTVYVNGKRRQVSRPQPIFRTAQIVSQVNVWDGQTLVLGGLVSERVITMKDGVPVLGDLPLAGSLFRRESKNTQKRNLLVFITPTIIDPAGNRVHADGQMPTAREVIPPQPAR